MLLKLFKVYVGLLDISQKIVTIIKTAYCVIRIFIEFFRLFDTINQPSDTVFIIAL